MSTLQARSRLGNATKSARAAGKPPESDEGVREARRDLAAAKLEQHISAIVATAPPLTPAQRAKLAALLRGAAK